MDITPELIESIKNHISYSQLTIARGLSHQNGRLRLYYRVGTKEYITTDSGRIVHETHSLKIALEEYKSRGGSIS